MNQKNKIKPNIMLLLVELTLYLSLFSQTKSFKNFLSSKFIEDPNPIPSSCRKIVCMCIMVPEGQPIDPYCPNFEANPCYENAECKQQENGDCDFTYSKPLRCCLTKAHYCKIAGSFNELCVESGTDLVSEKDIPENVCYKEAICKVQQTGKCGWTETFRFKNCIRKLRKKE